MGITLVGTGVYVNLPDGSSQTLPVPIAPDIVGTAVYWEIINVPGSLRLRWEQLMYVPLPAWGPM
jgi:hypothetical protein